MMSDLLQVYIDDIAFFLVMNEIEAEMVYLQMVENGFINWTNPTLFNAAALEAADQLITDGHIEA